MKNITVQVIQPSLPKDCALAWNYWRQNATGKKYIYYCTALDCGREDILPTFVKLIHPKDERPHLVPLCRLHQRTEGTIALNARVVPVLADQTL